MGPEFLTSSYEFLNHKPVILTGVGIQPTTDQGQSVYTLLAVPTDPARTGRVLAMYS